MKLLLTLTVSCITLALCQAACFVVLPKGEFINGAWAIQDGCKDPYHGTRYPYGSEWDSNNCLTCTCGPEAMRCCTSFGGTASVPGCKAVVDFATCSFKFYRYDNPKEPCF